ncbi:MAG: sigma 54-interacting transcriptional regulator [Planctomycetota bacterium]
MGLNAFQLIVRSGDERTAYTFDQGEVSIGRSRQCDLRLDDPLVSRRHCRIERQDDGGFVLIDEGSQNRPRLRGHPVERCELRDGDVIALGTSEVALAAAPPDLPSIDDTQVAEGPQSAEDLQAFVEIARALNEEQDLTRLLTSIMDAAIRLSSAERGFLILGQGEESTVEVARNFVQEDVLTPEFKISRTIAKRVRETGVPELTTNAQEDQRLRSLPSVEDLKLRSVLCLPLRVRGEVAGVLYVDNRLQQQVFKDREKALLLALADHAGIAIHNARTMEQLRAKRQEAQGALERVAQLNAALKGQLAAQKAELTEIREELSGTARQGLKHDYRKIVGESRRMRELFTMLDKYIDAAEPVLILGESGTGKELVAQAMWEHGPRGSGPFVTENVAALPESLLESELFGHEKGAFTGATGAKRGLLESATGGVLFLDEIGEMPLDLQAKLLRVIQEAEVRRLGAREPIKVDVRLITATNRTLEEMVRDGDFREDLYYRLNVLPVYVPPLRERREDIPALVHRFLLDADSSGARGVGGRTRVSPDAMEALIAHRWPGNVRELQNEVRRAAILSDGVILREHLSDGVRTRAAPATADDGGPVPAETGTTLPDLVRELEVREIGKAFERAGGNKSRAAQMLGLSRFALQRKLEKYGIGNDDGPAAADADPATDGSRG